MSHSFSRPASYQLINDETVNRPEHFLVENSAEAIVDTPTTSGSGYRDLRLDLGTLESLGRSARAGDSDAADESTNPSLTSSVELTPLEDFYIDGDTDVSSGSAKTQQSSRRVIAPTVLNHASNCTTAFREIRDVFSEHLHHNVNDQDVDDGFRDRLDWEIKRFKLWCAKQGALKVGPDSLDERLRGSEVMRTALLTHLRRLARLLETYKFLLQVESPSANQTSRRSVSDESSSEGTSSGSEIDDDGNKPPRLEFRFALKAIKFMIDELSMLSVKIRLVDIQPYIHSRIKTFTERDPSDDMDLFEAYARKDEIYVRETIHQLRAAEGGPEKGIDRDVLREGDDSIVGRLLATMNVRRKSIRYRTYQAVEPAWTTETPDSRQEDVSDAESADSYTSIASEDLRSGIEPVSLRATILTRGEFFCDFCGRMISAKYGIGRAWEVHLLRDLQPYICTYENCQKGDFLYRSKTDWLEHERASHRQAWRCPKHAAEVFGSQTEFLEHLTADHEVLMTEEQRKNMAKIAECTLIDARSKCPFCLASNISGKDLVSHMAAHMQQFAYHSAVFTQRFVWHSSRTSSKFALDSAAEDEDDSDDDYREHTRGKTETFSGRQDDHTEVLPSDMIRKSRVKRKGKARKRNPPSQMRAFPCVLATYGCQESFDSNNEWRRHINTQHVPMTIFRCRYCCPLSKSRAGPYRSQRYDFVRRDLFSMHIKRMHAVEVNIELLSTTSGINSSRRRQKDSSETTRILSEISRQCETRIRNPPEQAECILCPNIFSGPNCWEERTEHIATSHFEAAKKQYIAAPGPEEWHHDEYLEEWLIREEIIKRGRDGNWQLT